MNYVKYNRSLIMLEEQSNKFAAKEALPIKGYLKIETGNNKGALRCAVQNLKYYEKGDYIYKLILFGKKGEKTIHTIIGSLLVNRQGNGETYFRFQPLDIDGKGNCYHDYSTAIIAAASTIDDKEALHPVLKGITISEREPFQTELFEIDEKDTKTKEEIRDKFGHLEREMAKEREKSQDITDEQDIRQDTIDEQGKQRDIEDEANEQNVDSDEKDGNRYDAESDPQYLETNTERYLEAASVKKDYNQFYNEYLLNACAHTCRIAEYYEDVVPFNKDKTGARWKKIVNIMNLPLVSPGAHYFATQYHHYIFGAKADDKGIATRYFFGIPGRFFAEEQPDGGKSGFTYWQPIRGAEKALESADADKASIRNSAYGYWIVAIDGKNGNIEEV